MSDFDFGGGIGVDHWFVRDQNEYQEKVRKVYERRARRLIEEKFKRQGRTKRELLEMLGLVEQPVPVAEPVEEIPHNEKFTVGRYAYAQGCRCPDCRKANRDYERARDQRKRKVVA